MLLTEVRNSLQSLKDGSQKLKHQKNAGVCAKKNTKSYYAERKRNFDEKLKELDSKISGLEPFLNNFDNILDKV